MKKFLTYLTIIVSVAVIGFATYYLVQDEEQFYISETVKYVVVGEEFEIDAIWVNKKKSSSYEVFTLDEGIVALGEEPNTFIAVSGGLTSIYFRTTNEDYRNVSCKVFVSDGTIANPYYISSAEQFKAIGNNSEDYGYYTLNKSYKLLNDIDLNELDEEGNEVETYFTPIGLSTAGEFTGTFDGDGYTIKNLNIDPAHYTNSTSKDAGLFHTVAPGAKVEHVTLEDVNILSVGDDLGYAGAVTAYNFGTIERIAINGLNIQATDSSAVGGAVGFNASSESGSYDSESPSTSTYTRSFARVDRVAITDMLIGAGQEINAETNELEYVDTYGTGGYVGGLVGENHGGIIIYSYAVGDVFLNGLTTTYGGIVGQNAYLSLAETMGGKYTNNVGANVKDTYASIAVYEQSAFGAELVKT